MALDITPLLKLYAKYRIMQLNSQGRSRGALAGVQSRQLLTLINKAKDTTFGRDHNFSTITSVKQYQEQVPVRRYEEIWDQYWKSPFPNLYNCTWPEKIPFFALSSGTTSGTTKYIPYTREIMNATTKAGVDLLVHHVLNRPHSKILGGKSFILTGSNELVKQAPGIESGDMSGICMKMMPAWARKRAYPPPTKTKIESWEMMIDTFAEKSLSADIRSLNGAPSWMLLFLDKLRALRPNSGGKLGDLYPNLEMVVHGGMSFAPYKKVYDQILEGSSAETREVYPASEGFMAVQDRGYDQGMRLIIDHGIFYEFIPVTELDSRNPIRLTLSEVEVGIDYAIVLTTCAGLWSYLIGDIVRFVEVTPPRLLMTGRTSYMLSAVGEHLIGEEIDRCLLKATEDLNLQIAEYSVGAEFPTNTTELVGHKYVIEFQGSKLGNQPTTDQGDQLMQKLDLLLQEINEDYAAHRRNEFGLYPPKLIIAPPGTFNEWMRSRGKLGGQNKVPRVITKDEIFKDLLNFVEKFKNVAK